MRDNDAANDDGVLSLDDAIVLVEEVERLRAELARCEARIAELDSLAHQDPLVDLPNRRSFFGRLERTIAAVSRAGGTGAILFVDVDGLKTINDNHGHPAGDRALMQVARLLVASVRRADSIARLSGDEFGILIENADELTAWQMALRIVETVEWHDFRVGGVRVPLSVAVGVGMVQAGDDAQTVISRADKEMYRLKVLGGPQRPARV